jgi:Superinfection immunity protein
MGSFMTGGIVLVLLLILCLLLFYFLPSFIAFNRALRNRWAIFVVNLLLGATMVGWVISLVWAIVERPEGEYRSDNANKPTRDLRFQSETPSRDVRVCPECGETILAVAKRCKHCQADLRASAAPVAKGADSKQSPELQPLPLRAFRRSRLNADDESTTRHLWVGVGVVAVLAIAVTAMWGESLTPRLKVLLGGSSEQAASDEDIVAVKAKVKGLMRKVDAVEQRVSKYYILKGKMPAACSQLSGCVEGMSIGEDGRIVLNLNVAGIRELAGKSIIAFPSLIGRNEMKWRCMTNADFQFVPVECRNVIPETLAVSVST